MLNRIFFFLIGFGLSVIGFVYIILYLNVFTFGFSLKEYLAFVIKRKECLIAPIGLIILTFSIIKGGKTLDKYL